MEDTIGYFQVNSLVTWIFVILRSWTKRQTNKPKKMNKKSLCCITSCSRNSTKRSPKCSRGDCCMASRYTLERWCYSTCIFPACLCWIACLILWLLHHFSETMIGLKIRLNIILLYEKKANSSVIVIRCHASLVPRPPFNIARGKGGLVTTFL